MKVFEDIIMVGICLVALVSFLMSLAAISVVGTMMIVGQVFGGG